MVITNIDEGMEPVRIPAQGASLAGSVFCPGGTPRSVIVLHGATGIPQRFYRAFAAWLARRRQVVVLTYDYHDFGASADDVSATRRSTATMTDWGVHDQSAALAWVTATYPDLPIDVIGHSLGGMMLPFQEPADKVRAVVVIASGPAHWRKHPARYTPQVVAFWFGHAPLSVKALGYLPGKLSGFGADLPAGVYWQWRRWCVSANFYEGDYRTALPVPRPERLTGPMTFLAVADDVMIPPDRVEALQRYYPSAQRRFEVLRPADAGLRRIGHVGAFARRAEAIWPRIADSLDVA